MERRVFIAVLLSFAVLYTYQTYFSPPSPDASKAPAAATTSAGADAGKPAASPAAATPSVTEPAEPAPVALLGDQQAREVSVETPTTRVVFTNRGARVLHWYLKNYRDVNGESVDLVPSDLPESEPRPFSVQVENARDTSQSAPECVERAGQRLAPERRQ